MEIKNEIEKQAYDIFEKSGRIPGHEIEHWLEAEKIVRSMHAAAGNSKGAAAKKSAAPKVQRKKSTMETAGRMQSR
jgi:hypothetical protein